MALIICINCHENILDRIKVIERTRFLKKKSKGHNSIKTISEVAFFFLCTSSDGGLYSKGHNSNKI